MSRFALLLALLPLVSGSASVAAAGPPPGPPAPPAARPDVSEEDIYVDTNWSGVIRLDRRVRVLAGATLRVAPGTRVIVPRAAQEVVGPTRPGIEIFGGMRAEGDPAAPIHFEPEVSPTDVRESRGTTWMGIVVHPGSTLPVELVRCLVAEADIGLQPGRSSVTVRDCAFHACGSGVGVGSMWEGRDRLIGFVSDVSPRLEGCRFGGCQVGLTVEGDARPHVVRCVFLLCPTGIGNTRPGTTYPQSGLGPYVDRCEFLRCGVAVQGASRVTHGIFEQNELVYLGTRFGEVWDTSIDRFVRGRNLYADNVRLVRSDVPVDSDGIFATPKRRGRMPDDVGPRELLGPLDPWLGLAPGSPGLGAAADGGDLGAFGAAGATKELSGLAAGPGGLRAAQLLVLGPPSAVAHSKLPTLAAEAGRRTRLAGDLEGDAIWAALDADDLEDESRSRRIVSQLPEARVLLASFVGTEAGSASVRIGYDGTLEAFWNGESVVVPAGVRRYQADDVTYRVSVRKGTNALLLRHTPRATTGRCVIRLLSKDGTGAPLGLAPGPVGPIEKTPASAAVAGVTLTRETGRLGKMTGRASLRIALTGPVHWLGAVDRRRYRLIDGKGVAFDLSDATARYLPRERTVVLDLPMAPPPVAWTFAVEGLRRPTGEPFEEDGQTLPVRRP